MRATGSLSLATGTGQAFTLIATLASSALAGVPAATGTVQFVEGQKVLGTAPLTGSTATLALSAPTPGTHQVIAFYSGDANWYGLHSSALTLHTREDSGQPIVQLTRPPPLSEVQLTAE